MSCREVAESVMREKPFRCEIAGSLRRGEEYSHDVDIVCADPDMPVETERVERFAQNSCEIDIYHANPLHFGAMMFSYTGPKGYSIGYRKRAKDMGEAKGEEWKLNQYGLYKNGILVASENEEEIYESLKKTWKAPEERGK